MNKIRLAALAIAAAAIGLYVYRAVTYVPTSAYEPSGMGWLGIEMALPILAVTLVIMVFAFTGEGIMIALTGRNSAEFRAGLTGLGTVRSVRQTGVTVNDQPQVHIEFSVEGADGKIFHSSAKMIVPFTELALLRAGVVLPVRYLPGRTDKVEVDLSGDASAAQHAINESLIRKGMTTRHKLDIAERGIATQAVVQSLSVTGTIREGHSEVELGLVVTRPDGSTFATRVTKFLAPAGVGQVQVGRVLRAHYLPEKESEVVIALPVNA
ncbi:hypothetical protein IU486_05475 [Streptomyces gardneri]|uniref:hypothetical protein n=1 Tax=Nocardia TaxID=1817 RepID=UPI001356ABED|nr:MULTISPECIES: hypothetical protein [Nocardia]MBF6164226.1 hypothetical protein [Streptomyces gardneri]MBF6203800.1 hypothetical protein [Streptomyces gardneri]